MSWSPEADLVLTERAARAAGDVVMRYFRTEQKVTYKSPDQPLTEADLAADRLLKELLLGERPDYGWLSEETADTRDRLDREYVWLVDPIDGTRSFVAGRPEFAISVGLARSGAAIVGVVYNPATDELFSAVRGSSAIALLEPERRPVLAASRSEIAKGEFAAFSTDYELLPTGSTAYKLARVASGAADAFFSRGPKSEWDVCAGDLIAEQAGAIVTDLHGRRLQYNRPDPHIDGIIAGRNGLHRDILDRVEALK